MVSGTKGVHCSRVLFFDLAVVLFCFIWDFSWMGSPFMLTSTRVLITLISVHIYLILQIITSVASIRYALRVMLVLSILFFISTKYILLYVLLELSLLPLLLLLLAYGAQVQKTRASLMLILFSSVGALPILWVYVNGEVWRELPYESFFSIPGVILFALGGFLIKFPVYFFHYWLPLVHVEAPTSARMWLAGVMLKIGVVGFMYFMPPMSLHVIFHYRAWAFIGMVLLLPSCISRIDSKVVAAYSSVVHMSFLLFTAVSFRGLAWSSTLLIVIGHGYISTLWFYYIGLSYIHTGTRLLYILGGAYSSRRVYFVLFFLLLLMNRGAPLSLSFLSEVGGISYISSTYYWYFLLIVVVYFGTFYYRVVVGLSLIVGKSSYTTLLTRISVVPLIYLINFNIFLY